jgi:hypothetical protein
MAEEISSPASDEPVQNKMTFTFTPPEKHVATDKVGKTLGNMAGSINRALGTEAEPVVLNRKGRHVSIKSLEDLIDKALEE